MTCVQEVKDNLLITRDEGLRASALELLCEAAANRPELRARVLDMLIARQTERESIRLQGLQALKQVPLGTREELAKVTGLIRGTLQARMHPSDHPADLLCRRAAVLVQTPNEKLSKEKAWRDSRASARRTSTVSCAARCMQPLSELFATEDSRKLMGRFTVAVSAHVCVWSDCNQVVHAKHT